MLNCKVPSRSWCDALASWEAEAAKILRCQKYCLYPIHGKTMDSCPRSALAPEPCQISMKLDVCVQATHPDILFAIWNQADRLDWEPGTPTSLETSFPINLQRQLHSHGEDCLRSLPLIAQREKQNNSALYLSRMPRVR
jgi:hypothetical protein